MSSLISSFNSVFSHVFFQIKVICVVRCELDFTWDLINCVSPWCNLLVWLCAGNDHAVVFVHFARKSSHAYLSHFKSGEFKSSQVKQVFTPPMKWTGLNWPISLSSFFCCCFCCCKLCFCVKKKKKKKKKRTKKKRWNRVDCQRSGRR